MLIYSMLISIFRVKNRGSFFYYTHLAELDRIVNLRLSIQAFLVVVIMMLEGNFELLRHQHESAYIHRRALDIFILLCSKMAFYSC